MLRVPLILTHVMKHDTTFNAYVTIFLDNIVFYKHIVVLNVLICQIMLY